MFSSDAKLFLNANNNVNCAKTLINECIRLVSDVVVPDNDQYTSLKSNLENSGIAALVDRVENTKKSLFELDHEFANEYMALVQESLQTQSIDVSNMSSEEKELYNIEMNSYYRDYNYNLLYILEKYASSGQLTDELINQLTIQRVLVEQYELKDKMDVLSQTSDEYIIKFKENAELERNLIFLDNSLSQKEKDKKIADYDSIFKSNVSILELNNVLKKENDELSKLAVGSEEYFDQASKICQIKIDYYEEKGNLTDEEKDNLSKLKNNIKLNDLYIEKGKLDDNWIPFDENDLDEDIFKIKRDMGIASKDEIEYLEMSGVERALMNTGTFINSFFIEGLFNIEEGIVDGLVTIAGGVGSIFGADTQWAEDFVSVDISGDAYEGLVVATGVNSVIAYNDAHSIGSIAGEVIGIIGLQFLPGGTAVTVASHGLRGMGSSSEYAFNNDKSYGEAFAYGLAVGSIEAAAAYVLYSKPKATFKPLSSSNSGSVALQTQGTSNLLTAANSPPALAAPTVANSGSTALTNVSTSVAKGTSSSTALTNVGTSVVKSTPTSVVSSSPMIDVNTFFGTPTGPIIKTGTPFSLSTKLGVAASKEYAKEAAGGIIDESFDFKEATSNATIAMGTVLLNESLQNSSVGNISSNNVMKGTAFATKSVVMDDVKK